MTERREKMVGPVSLKAPQSFFDRIDAWRAVQRPIPNRGDAIRRLVELGLETLQKADKPVKGRKA
jgi:hypothetical protein